MEDVKGLNQIKQKNIKSAMYFNRFKYINI